MDRRFWNDIDAARARCDVLAHPFYVRWSAGTLRPGELADYAAQYEHLVRALATASRRAADALPGEDALARHAAEEEAHVELWRAFGAAVGVPCGAKEPARPPTARAAVVWAGGARDAAEEHLVRLYAIESAQPAIAVRKLDGLGTHYGIGEGEATAYFTLHATIDREHAALARRALQARASAGAGVDLDVLRADAEAVHRAYWEMLDGIEDGPAATPALA